MDFGQLLHVAKKNSEQSKNSAGKYYSTKFSAPKKVSKEKALSDNIKKFLIKKEQEEREKARQEKAKLDNLIAKRDEKSKNKIRKMLKVTKSANKSVLDDAIDDQHTSVTMQGPDQPDEDDYGYVSNEAAAFFQKYVDKVGKLPDENKFAPSRPQSKNDLRGTKDRVKAAILREQEEKHGITRTKTSTVSSTSLHSSANSTKSSGSRKDLYDPEAESEEKRKRDEEQRKSKIKKTGGPPPPILDFKELLKLAEKKQFEPVAIKKPEVEKEPERLLTKREKLEMEQRKAYLEDRIKKGANNVQKMQPNGKIPKLNSTGLNSSQNSKDPFKKPTVPQKIISSSSAKPKSNSVTNGSQQQNDLRNKNITQQKPKSSISMKVPSTTTGVSNSGQQQKKISTLGQTNNNSNNNKISTTANGKSNYNGPTREFPPKDIKRVPSQQNLKTREFPPKDLQKTRQFPPPDVRRSRPDFDRKPMKRRIYDDYDDEDEYDSELDDFIEDDPEGERNVSSYIKEIFGYDKSRYRDCEDDIDNMESNFAQQMREETISKKIGLMEDLEDMKKEADEKKKKNIMKKKKFK